jgi:V-type H+-transporting ATPase subunit a
MIITFPFLFAVIFGEVGHGFLMILFALWMVLKERSLAVQKSNNEIWLTFFNERYIILLMGCFSIYTGIIYNDIFSKSINLFGSSWISPKPELNHNEKRELQFINKANSLDLIYNQTSTIYPFEMDPVWQISENKILFLNSIKMKVSVILGVSQMFYVFRRCSELLESHVFQKIFEYCI